MKDEDKEKLASSLFSSTSAFVQPVDLPYPVEIVQPIQVTASTPTEDWVEVVALLEQALAGTTDTEVLMPLEQALELARQHV